MKLHGPEKLSSYPSNEIISFKSRPLGLAEVAEIEYYLDHSDSEPLPLYVQKLYHITLSQLVKKAGFDIKQYPDMPDETERKRLEKVAKRLTVHFLKRKLNRIKEPEQLAFKKGSELLDPHFHLNSIYVKDNQHLLNLLPNFEAIYSQIRSVRKSKERELELLTEPDILTDAQFLGEPPESIRHPQTGQKRLSKTVGYVRGTVSNKIFKEGFITKYAKTHGGTCLCCDMCGPETRDNWRDVERYLNHTIRHKAQIIRIHIGETHIPQHGKKNVEELFRLLDQKKNQGDLTNQTIRLGHGTHMGISHMRECQAKGYYVEACLSSNKETGIITKRKEYPLGLMLLLDVKVMIGTDGGNMYYTNLKNEYGHARDVLDDFLRKVKKGNPDERIQLPNRDILQYRDIKHLFVNIPQADNWHDTKEITYQDLKLIEETCKEKVNMGKLVDNMNEFKEKMFPGQTRRAKLKLPKERLLDTLNERGEMILEWENFIMQLANHLLSCLDQELIKEEEFIALEKTVLKAYEKLEEQRESLSNTEKEFVEDNIKEISDMLEDLRLKVERKITITEEDMKVFLKTIKRDTEEQDPYMANENFHIILRGEDLIIRDKMGAKVQFHDALNDLNDADIEYIKNVISQAAISKELAPDVKAKPILLSSLSRPEKVESDPAQKLKPKFH